jgi:hypothetical protein
MGLEAQVRRLYEEGAAMTVEQYCKQCNAPHKPLVAVMMRCGLCAVINGKLPPTKYQPLKAAHGIKGAK